MRGIRQRALVGVLSMAVLVVACATGRVPVPVEAAAPPGSAGAPPESGSATGGEDPLTVDEVFARIAAMDLTDEERVAYLEERAREEGRVLLYGVQQLDLQEAWVDAFTADHPGIEYEFVRQRGAEVYERFTAEERAGRHLADVVYVDPMTGAALRELGLFAELHGVPVPPGYPDRYVASWAVGGMLTPHVIAWNTGLVDDGRAPRDWDDFVRPEHAGCVIDSDASQFVAMMLATRGRDATVDWLVGFAENGGVVREGLPGMAQAVAAGEHHCAVYLHAFFVEELIVEDGAPLGWHAPDPSPVNVTAAHVSSHAPHPHAAALLVHWLTGERGSRFVADMGRIPANPAIRLGRDRLRPWNELDSDLAERSFLVDPPGAVEVFSEVRDLVERYVLPGLVSD